MLRNLTAQESRVERNARKFASEVGCGPNGRVSTAARRAGAKKFLGRR